MMNEIRMFSIKNIILFRKIPFSYHLLHLNYKILIIKIEFMHTID